MAALKNSLLPHPFKVVQVCPGVAIQSWIRVLWTIQHSGAMHKGMLKLLSPAPTHPAQHEREKSRCDLEALSSSSWWLSTKAWTQISGYHGTLRSSGTWTCYSCLPSSFEMLELTKWVWAHQAGSNTAVLPGLILFTLLSTWSLLIKTIFIAWHGMSQKASYRKKANCAWMPVFELHCIFLAVLSCEPEFQ